MSLNLSITNITGIISIMSPILISFFLIMSSLFNQDIKGIIFIMGAMMAMVINVVIMNLIKQSRNVNEAFACNIFDIPFMTKYNSPSPSSVFISFSMVYILLPMLVNSNINIPIIIFFISLLLIDSYSKVLKRCTNFLGSFMGIALGSILGAVWYSIFKSTDNSALLYFDELKSNTSICNKPSRQTFKCRVFKNGELLGAQ
jgi:hypothetical protein